MTNRFLRKDERTTNGLEIQPRDQRIVCELARFRYLTALQLQDLVAPSIARRVFQRRLRLLYDHRVLDRHPLPAAYGNPRRAMPVYSLGPVPVEGVDTSPALRPSAFGLPPTVHHGLVAADFLIAVGRAAEGVRKGLHATLEPEAMLWRALARWRLKASGRRSAIVPDGAVTIRGTESVPPTYAIEVIRADLRGGNRVLIPKLERYGLLARQRFFADAYGWQRLRAVLVLVSSDVRARHLRELAARARLTIPVVFGSYATAGRAFTEATVRGPVFTDTRGGAFALFPPVCA